MYPDRESARADFCWLAKRLMELTNSDVDLYAKVCGAEEIG